MEMKNPNDNLVEKKEDQFHALTEEHLKEIVETQLR